MSHKYVYRYFVASQIMSNENLNKYDFHFPLHEFKETKLTIKYFAIMKSTNVSISFRKIHHCPFFLHFEFLFPTILKTWSLPPPKAPAP